MDVAKERNDITTTLSNQKSLENVDKFVYLGSTISHNGNLTPELDNRIGKAANAFNRLLPVMRHKSIKMPTKIAIYQAVVLSTLLYGSESWNTTVREEKRLAAFHTRCLRRILGVSWQDHVPNAVIFERTSQVPLINILRHKRLTWARTCHPYAPNSPAPPLAPLGTTRAPSPRQTTHALERHSVERPTRL